ncbi:MAG: RHS domain-containing protein, partial [Candidatus Brocadiales bacterium]|nr:RHS domain-containing protein [Candidatus Brocadiales bacterium]
YQYDVYGNVTHNGRKAFTYDDASNLIGVPNTDISFQYDGHNQRIVENRKGKTLHTIYNKAGLLMHEADVDGDYQKDFIYLGRALIAERNQEFDGCKDPARDDDKDGIPNCTEKENGLDPNDPEDAKADPDNDGLTNLEEYQHGTDYNDADSDDDGYKDGYEVDNGLNPLKPTSRRCLISMLSLLNLFTSPVMAADATNTANQYKTTITYYLNDALGSPVMATDEKGEVIWREMYKPFGERIFKKKASKQHKTWYTSKVEDQDLGLSYYGARYYDTLAGRFNGVDPVGFQGNSVESFNAYMYANNNPYLYFDPDGEVAFLIPLAIFIAKEIAGEAVEQVTGIPAPTVKNIGKQIIKKTIKKKVIKSTIQANKAAGDAVRDVIAARTGGVIEKNFRVTGGLRRVDVLDGTTAIESKVGRTGLSKRVKQELARDVKMLRSGQVDKVQWEFSRSGVTGKVGPTGSSPFKVLTL